MNRKGLVKDKEASLSCTHCTLLLIVGVVVWVPGVTVGAQPFQQGVALAPALLLVPIVVMVGGPRPAHRSIRRWVTYLFASAQNLPSVMVVVIMPVPGTIAPVVAWVAAPRTVLMPVLPGVTRVLSRVVSRVLSRVTPRMIPWIIPWMTPWMAPRVSPHMAGVLPWVGWVLVVVAVLAAVLGLLLAAAVVRPRILRLGPGPGHGPVN